MVEFDDELALLEEAVRGDPIAVQALLIRHRLRLLQYVKRHLPVALSRQVEADDVVQDVFVEAVKRLGEFAPRGTDSFARWLMTIARHRMIDLLRAQQAAKRGSDRQLNLQKPEDDGRVVALIETLAVYHRTPSRSAAAHELAAALERSIGELPPDYRQAIRLRHIDGLAAKDAAIKMNRTEGAFHLLCNRGLKQLRETMRSASIFV